MSAWKDVITAALLGTDRSAPPLLPAALQNALGPMAELDRETRFLAQAGSLALWRRAGGKPAESKDAFAPAAAELGKPVSRKSAAHLRTMLSGASNQVLPEWLDEVTRLGRLVPPEFLPALLERAWQNRALRASALVAGGQRAQWLAGHNPEWSFAGSDHPIHWDTGGREQRLAILRAERAKDPVGARLRVEGVWAAEPADLRAAFLGELAVNLSEADAPFLEAALDDRSKEVRRVAVELLVRLPASPFVGRMLARAQPLVVFNRGGLLRRAALEIVLPSEPDAAGVRDGLDGKAFGSQKVLGEKAVWLVLIVSAVPLAHWTTMSGEKPGGLLKAAEKNEFARALATAWALAAGRQANAEWAAALLDGPISPYEELLQGCSLLRVLPEPARAARLESEVRGGALTKTDPANWHALAAALGEFQNPWPLSLGRRILEAVRLASIDGLPWQVRASAESLLLRLPSALLPDSLHGWPEHEASVAGLLELLAFRHEALAALHQP